MSTIVDLIQLIIAQTVEIQRLTQVAEQQRKCIEELEQQAKPCPPPSAHAGAK